MAVPGLRPLFFFPASCWAAGASTLGPSPRRARNPCGLPAPGAASSGGPCRSGSAAPGPALTGPGSPRFTSWVAPGPGPPGMGWASSPSGAGASSPSPSRAWVSSWARPAAPDASSPRAWALAGPRGLGAVGSKSRRSLGRRAPGAPGREPEGCFANACTFLLVSGPLARASATDLVAAWVAGAPAHCLARRSQNLT